MLEVSKTSTAMSSIIKPRSQKSKVSLPERRPITITRSFSRQRFTKMKTPLKRTTLRISLRIGLKI
jgi:hypothetical protein